MRLNPPPADQTYQEQHDGDDQQLGLWDEDEDWREAEDTIDAVTARFGRGMLRPASLLKAKAPRGDAQNAHRIDYEPPR